MQLKLFALVVCLLALGAGGAAAQSLSPMRAEGATPSDIKGFRLTVGNPYKARMTFIVMAMDPKFEVEIAQAAVSVPEFRLAPGASRPIVVQFRIDPALKERTIGVCVQPKDLEGPILPRVCGTYTGWLAGTRR
ncbi:MAG: hypothetical protein EOP22_09460 [Hyphomicrobiales bacterium]|nr:MAG: hypothetical protein EOP22_09460 [Hyphomicrobiales bacterium]